MANSKPIVGYWGIRGLAQPIRFMVAYLGLEITDKRYTSFDDWAAEKNNLGLDFPNLPYYFDGDIKLTETRAILKHLARENLSVNPSTPEEIRACDMVENVLWDVWFGLLRYCNTGLETMKSYFENEIPKKIGYLNKFMENKAFVRGDQISYVDFIFYEILYHYTTLQADYFDKYSTLQKYKQKFEEIPAIAKYIASPEYIKAPCINPLATIKI